MRGMTVVALLPVRRVVAFEIAAMTGPLLPFPPTMLIRPHARDVG